jgi:alkylhydroperoxidase family enzyme
MVDYALRLTDSPASVRREDVDSLRAAGLDDRAILDLVLIVGYFAFVNRLADGLGVPLEDWWRREPEP